VWKLDQDGLSLQRDLYINKSVDNDKVCIVPNSHLLWLKVCLHTFSFEFWSFDKNLGLIVLKYVTDDMPNITFGRYNMTDVIRLKLLLGIADAVGILDIPDRAWCSSWRWSQRHRAIDAEGHSSGAASCRCKNAQLICSNAFWGTNLLSQSH